MALFLSPQFEEVQQKNQKLEVDIASVQARLVNLQVYLVTACTVRN